MANYITLLLFSMKEDLLTMQSSTNSFRFKDWPKSMKLLISATFLMSVSLAFKDSVFTNFANDLGIQADQLGIIESVREVPGLLTVVMAMLTYFFTESLLASLSLLVLGIGMLVFSVSSGFIMLVFASVVYSIGFHLYFPLQESMALKMGTPEESGRLLGLFGSVASTASLCGMGSLIFLTKILPPSTLFFIAGIFGLLGGIILLTMPRPERIGKPKTLIFKKKYKFYYILTFLSGCRRHIFTIFAPFVLVSVYHVDLTTMTILMTVNQALNIFTKRRIGQIIDTMGEKVALTLNFALLIFIFLGYGYVKNLYVLFGLYIIDNVCFGFNMSISTYLRKICSVEDLGPSLTMGSTVNHIAAVFIPIVGGILWNQFGYQFAFIMGAGISAISLLVTYMIKDAQFTRKVQHTA